MERAGAKNAQNTLRAEQISNIKFSRALTPNQAWSLSYRISGNAFPDGIARVFSTTDSGKDWKIAQD
jgi:hypothetical protein